MYERRTMTKSHHLFVRVNVIVDSAPLGGDGLQQSGIVVRPKPKRVDGALKLQIRKLTEHTHYCHFH